MKPFLLCLFCLIAAFIKPLFDLARLSLHSDLFSHVLLIPAISAYLVWLKRKELTTPGAKSPILAILPIALGIAAQSYYWLSLRSPKLPMEDYLAVTIFSFVCFLWGAAALTLGWNCIRQIAFPVLFLIFMVPFPTAVTIGIERFFQHYSADAANLLFSMVDVPFVRDGQYFRLPGLSMLVAEECSGIRSSLVLFITSLIAGHMFLRCPGRRAALALFVIPLGIMRNGFRIFTIGMLSSYVNPAIMESPLHRRGGPLFFLLSLIPFFLLLLWLRRTERKSQSTSEATSTNPRKPPA